jgi:L-glutamine-phosphate cytidylyltransferase
VKLETAVILAAGVGSRLRPITDDRPKALVAVGTETIIGRACRLLSSHGAEKLVLATGYREDSLRRELASFADRLAFCRNERFDSTQNSVSLALCRPEIGGAFVKLDGDVVFEPALLERLIALETDADLVVLVDSKRPRDAEAMKVRLDGERVLEFGKGIPLSRAHAETIGVEWLSARGGERVLAAIDAHVARGEVGLYYEDVYSELVAGGALRAIALEVGDLRWTEVDTFEDLEHARRLVASGA